MKKVLFMAVALTLAGALSAQAPNTKTATNANKPPYGNFVDKNNDGICDNFTDANKDGRCDNCVYPNGNCANRQNRNFRQGRGQGAGIGRGGGRCQANCPYNNAVQNKQ